MAQAYAGTKISEHIIRDNAGFLICTAPICRSGWQEYRLSELDPARGDDSIVRVYRDPREVTSAATIASVEGKPLTMNHPAQFLSPDSWAWAAKGHAQNARVGPPDKDGNVQLFADLHVQDQSLIDRIMSGTRELSCGYMYELTDGPEPDTYEMRKIRMNHIAVVPVGRAGTSAIIDAHPAEHIFQEDEDTIPMAKTKDTCEVPVAILERLAGGLEALVSRQRATDMDEVRGDRRERPEEFTPLHSAPYGGEGNVNPVADAARRALDSLRALRPAIEASGDRVGIDNYNHAVKLLKQRIKLADAAGDLVGMSRTIQDGSTKSAAEDFEDRVRDHRDRLNGRRVRSDERRAEDEARPGEDYEASVARIRRKMLEK